MSERNICTKENPFSRDKRGMWQHPKAVHVSEIHDNSAMHDDYDTLECPICSLVFNVTIPN